MRPSSVNADHCLFASQRNAFPFGASFLARCETELCLLLRIKNRYLDLKMTCHDSKGICSC